MIHFLRVVVSGLVGGIAWIAGMIFFFGPAQHILADPRLQSAKFIAVMGEIEPLPRMAGSLWIIVVGLLMIGVIYGIVFSFIGPLFSGNSLLKGIKFGLISWALMVPWFEFYLPWNVMHEPALLVLLEIMCWAVVMLLVGMSISLTSKILEPRKSHNETI